MFASRRPVLRNSGARGAFAVIEYILKSCCEQHQRIVSTHKYALANMGSREGSLRVTPYPGKVWLLVLGTERQPRRRAQKRLRRDARNDHR